MSTTVASQGGISHNGEHPDTSSSNTQTSGSQSSSSVLPTRFFYTKDKILSLYNSNSKPAPRYKAYEIIESKDSIKPINLVTPEQLEELIREPPIKLNNSGGIGFPSPRLMRGRNSITGIPGIPGDDRPRNKSFDLGDMIKSMSIGSPDSPFLDDPVAVDSSNDVKWRYKDPKGEIQGPFNTFDMDSWYTAGYFGPDLLVKMENQAEFVPLRQLIKPQQLFPFALLAVEVNEPILKPLPDAPKPEVPVPVAADGAATEPNPLGTSGGVPRTGLLEAPPKRRGSMPGVGVLNGSFGFPTYPPPPIYANLDRRASYTPPVPGPGFGRRGSGTYYSFVQDTPVPPLPQPQFSPDIRVNMESLRNSSSATPPPGESSPLRSSGNYPDPSTLHRNAQHQYMVQQMMQQQMAQQQMMQQQMAVQQMMQQQKFQQERANLHQHNMEQQKLQAQRKLESPKSRN